jgi:hypothetical protein
MMSPSFVILAMRLYTMGTDAPVLVCKITTERLNRAIQRLVLVQIHHMVVGKRELFELLGLALLG